MIVFVPVAGAQAVERVRWGVSAVELDVRVARAVRRVEVFANRRWLATLAPSSRVAACFATRFGVFLVLRPHPTGLPFTVDALLHWPRRRSSG